MTTINIKLINKHIYHNFSLPKYMTSGAAGLDLAACIKYPITIYPKKTHLIPTGIAIHINNVKIAGIILPRSGLGHNHGIILGNSIGLIDSDYQGELMISIWNRGKKRFIINPGKRIAQLVFLPIIKIKFSLVQSFNPSIRGSGGFGHSL